MSAARDVVAYARRTAAWLPVLVIVLLAMPMALTNRSFGHDWTLHLWAIRQQQLNIQATGHPTLFVSPLQLGVFYPLFAYVGSGVYSVGGYLAIALGGRPILAYKLLYVVALGMAYGGATWLAVQRGLRGWRAQIPGLVLVTGAYMITDMAGRGDFGEFIALASIPLVVAAGCAVLAGSRVRARDVIAFTVAMFVFTGSHNITLMWGAVFLLLLAAVAAVAFAPTWGRPLPVNRALVLIGAGVVGVGLNAWYLAPDFAYGLNTVVARTNADKIPLTILEGAGLLLNPLRPSSTKRSAIDLDIRTALPWLFLVWTACVAAVAWRRERGVYRRLLIGLAAMVVGYLTLAILKAPWHLVPSTFYNIQFTWRLQAYVLLASMLLVLVALGWQDGLRERTRRLSTTALVVIVAFTIGIATWQVWRVRSNYHVTGQGVTPANSHFADVVVAARTDIPPSWYSKDQFRELGPERIPTKQARMLTVPVADVHGTTYSGTLPVPDGPAPFRTNISAGPHYVTMTGIRAIGTTQRGYVIAVRAPGTPANGPLAVTIRQADTTVLRDGALFSLLSAIALVALLAWGALRMLRTRRGFGGVRASARAGGAEQ